MNLQSQFSSLAEAPWQQNRISPQHHVTDPWLPPSVHEEQTCDAQMWSTGTLWSCTRREVDSLVANRPICIVSLLKSSPWCRNVTVVKRTHIKLKIQTSTSFNSDQKLLQFKCWPPFSLTSWQEHGQNLKNPYSNRNVSGGHFITDLCTISASSLLHDVIGVFVSSSFNFTELRSIKPIKKDKGRKR